METWLKALAPVVAAIVVAAGIVLLLAVPLLAYLLYPPEVKQGTEVPAWAAQELQKMGAPNRRELLLALLVLIALALWTGPDAGHHGHPDTLWHRSEPGLLRQRLPARRRLLAAWRHLRRDLHRRVLALGVPLLL